MGFALLESKTLGFLEASVFQSMKWDFVMSLPS